MRERGNFLDALAKCCQPIQDCGFECNAVVGPAVIGGDVYCGRFVAAARFDGVHKRIRTAREAIVGRKREERSLGEASCGAIESKLFAMSAHLVGHAFGGDAGQGLHVVRHHGHKTIARDVGLSAHVCRGNKYGAN